MGRLNGRTALVTGAARGIGAQIARRFAEEGAIVIINDLDLAAAQATADTLKGHALACDVSHSESVNAMFEQVAAITDSLDILVNNAGIGEVAAEANGQKRTQPATNELAVAERANMPKADPPILDVTDHAWSRMLGVHLNGTFNCSRAAVDLMMRNTKRPIGGAAIINMASIMGTTGAAGASAYSAAKGGILGFTRALAHELAPYGVRVNAIAPGFIRTDMTMPAEQMFPMLEAQTPLGRIGDTDDIAWAAVYLASAEAKFVTGQTLSPNGGWYMSQ